MIPTGVMFGPYPGQLVNKSTYINTGFGWAIRDEAKGKVIGIRDPAMKGKPDEDKEWMAYVNSACFAVQQNVVALQV